MTGSDWYEDFWDDGGERLAELRAAGSGEELRRACGRCRHWLGYDGQDKARRLARADSDARVRRWAAQPNRAAAPTVVT